ncbi:MAG: DUF4255 domain-containing protein [bacterium]|nr:DUF4255 domain-containing protein [bacterium]
MIHELDSTFERILYEQGKINRRDVDIAFDAPTSEWSARVSRPTLNMWCFDLRENMRLRNADLSTKTGKNGGIGRAAVPPRRYDLAYLLTSWARKMEDEHQLLWRALGALMQVPLITEAMSVGDALKGQPYDIPVTVANPGEVHANITDLWSVLNNQMRLGFVVVATLALDTGRGFEAPLVFEKRLVFGQSSDPESETIETKDTEVVQKADRSKIKP